ncbi:MAG: hypothetical protein SAK29_25100 [Scytonema sp. PMC 1069.18]|nr:hypothetical protein [Scytonema sp. PMC 1069.18]
MSTQDIDNSPKELAKERIEEERMRDILLLVTHLVNNQEVTLKLILDALYDVGSVNLINQRFQSRSLNTLGRAIARMSKPAFRIFALRWVRKNCPLIITNWLRSKVSFPELNNAQQPVSTSVVSEVQLDSLSRKELHNREEIKRLRSEVRYLAGISVGTLASLVSILMWVGYNSQARTVTTRTTTSVSTCVQSADVDGKKELTADGRR